MRGARRSRRERRYSSAAGSRRHAYRPYSRSLMTVKSVPDCRKQNVGHQRFEQVVASARNSANVLLRIHPSSEWLILDNQDMEPVGHLFPPSVSSAGRSTLDANRGLGALDNNGRPDSPGCSLRCDHCSTHIGFGSRRQHDIPVFGARSEYDISGTIVEFADDQPQAVARG